MTSEEKPRRGRPPLPEDQKTISQHVRVMRAQWKRAGELAEARGVTVAEYIRDAITEKNERESIAL